MPSIQSIPEEQLDLPTDLRQCLGESTLVRLVVCTLRDVDHDPEEPSRNRPSPPGLPRTCLSLLTYSYAIGLYGSDAIANQIPDDPNLLDLVGKITPSADDLRRFRRAHRALLKRSLSCLLQLTWHAWKGASSLSSPNDSQLALLCESAAERRINEAVFIDSMALDF